MDRRVVQINSSGGTVLADVLAFIEGLQPYCCVNAPDAHPRWVISEVDNMDKHRTLALTVAAPQSFRFGINAMGDVNLSFGQIGGYHGLFDEHTELASAQVTVTGPDPHVDMPPRGTIEIAFAPPALNAGKPGVSTLANLRDYVVDVVDIVGAIAIRNAVT